MCKKMQAALPEQSNQKSFREQQQQGARGKVLGRKQPGCLKHPLALLQPVPIMGGLYDNHMCTGKDRAIYPQHTGTCCTLADTGACTDIP